MDKTEFQFAACPFCGGEDVECWTVSSSRDPLLIDAQHYVGCNSCGATLCDDDAAETREHWNRRASTPPPPSLVTKLDVLLAEWDAEDGECARAYERAKQVGGTVTVTIGCTADRKEQLRAILKDTAP